MAYSSEEIESNGKSIGLTDNAIKVLANRYLAKDETGQYAETPTGMFRRVSNCVAKAEEAYEQGSSTGWSDEYYSLMATGKFIPNSPTIMNAGREMGMLSACFVLPLEDSVSSIFDTVKATAIIQKAGGGTGFNLDNLRPSGDYIKSSGGTTSGPMAFWKVLSETTCAIAQGAFRRGANMAMCDLAHPDALKFLFAKQDLSKFQNYNISAKITDAWMTAYRANPNTPNVVTNKRTGKSYVWPRTLDIETYQIQDLIPLETYNAVEVKPDVWTMGQVFDVIVKNAWQTGEPGCCFIDRANQHNTTPHVGMYETTNPCVTGDTWVLTNEGPKQVTELLGRPHTVIVDGFPYASTDAGFFTTGTKDIVELRVGNGYRLKLTTNHKVLKVTDAKEKVAEWAEAGSLIPGDRVAMHNHRALAQWPGNYTEEQGYLIGALLGDGHITNDRGCLEIWDSPTSGIGTEAERCIRTLPSRSSFKGWWKADAHKFRMTTRALTSLAAELGMTQGNKVFSSALEKTSGAFHIGFLRGLFDADGSVSRTEDHHRCVTLTQADRPLLEGVQRMLARLGIMSSIYLKSKAGPAKFPGNRVCQCKEAYYLSIRNDNIRVFNDRIGFADEKKAAKLEAVLNRGPRPLVRETFAMEVKGVTPVGTAEVYDVQIPGINCFDANGITTHNCGEIFLLPWEACNLASINVSKFVENGAVNWEAFKRVVHTGVRFLDDIIDVNNYQLPQIDKIARGNRKIGLGLMGVADTMFELGIPYNTSEGVEFGRQLMKFLNDESHNASEALARERGVFPYWAGSTWDTKHNRPMRHSCCTTVAPTGTISIIAGCSSGIEPIFSLAFFRHVMRNHKGDATSMVEINEQFKRIAEANNFFGLGETELYERIAKDGTTKNIESIPDSIKRVFASAGDVEPEWHVRMQAAFQEHCDNSISKTINMPETATEQDVRTIYTMAYDTGCKGVTVYRNNCRAGQPMALAAKPVAATAPVVATIQKTATVSPAVRIRQKTPFGHMHVSIVVDVANNKELEIFAQLGKAGETAGADLEAICRMASLFLRSGGKLKDVISQLNGIGSSFTIPTKDGSISSLGDAVAKALKKYNIAKEKHGLKSVLLGEIDLECMDTKDTETVEVKQRYALKCPSCETGELVKQEGCVKCHSCGYSKC